MHDFIKTIGLNFWQVLSEMSPYLLFGFAVAGLLSVFINAQIVEKHLGGAGFWPVFKASLFGVPLPLCSCGVIPVSMSLHKHGASKGATISFLLSTPQTGVDSILVTYGLMGPIFAVFRPVAAFITGLLGGSVVNLFEKHNTHTPQEKKESCTDDCCANHPKQNRLLRAAKHGFITLPADIGRAMFVGLVIAALISALIPEDFFAETLAVSGGGILAMLVMMVLGIPVYVCATASVPIAAALIAKGLNPGAAMVFLMTGPATNAATLVTLTSQLGKRSALIFLLTVMVSSLVCGIILDAIFRGDISQITHAHGFMLPGWFKSTCAVILLAVLGYGIFAKKPKAENN
ncbi:MAG: SO_0444 family Cu/Zn efflux transporter [Phycisphaerae bacterium]|nr:SO_0444 family Cu/Zn efflux transporter [Phycisphaerae bacterium]